MAEPRAVVDVVGAHDHAAELLHEVAVFVGGLGAGEGAEATAVRGETVGGGVECLVPGRLVPAAIALDHGLRDPVVRMDEAGGEAALHAEHAEARAIRGRVVGHQRQPPTFLTEGETPLGLPTFLTEGETPLGLPLAHPQHDAAAHAAVGAGGRDGAGDLARRVLGPQRARRARGDALAARRAHRRGHGPVAEDADLGGVAPPEERDGADLLNVVAGDGAAPAEDAGVAVEDEERLARVLVVDVQRRPRGLEPAVARGGVAELAEAVAIVTWSEHRVREVEHHRPHAHDLGMLGVHDHAVPRGEVAGGRRAPLPLDVDETRAARAERRAIGILAELWQRDAEVVDGVEDRGPVGKLDAASVDDDDHARLMIRRTPGETPRAPRARQGARPDRGRRATRAGPSPPARAPAPRRPWGRRAARASAPSPRGTACTCRTTRAR